jgi:hypothetical protein
MKKGFILLLIIIAPILSAQSQVSVSKWKSNKGIKTDSYRKFNNSNLESQISKEKKIQAEIQSLKTR